MMVIKGSFIINECEFVAQYIKLNHMKTNGGYILMIEL